MVSLDQENRHLIETKHIHESNELHIWCRHNEQKMDAEKDKNYMLSSKAGEMVVRNALLCLKKGWSSEEFVSLNDKDNLTIDLNGHVATKNDSRAEFFNIREVVFEKVTQS